jgi:hypothetical protein
VVFPASCALYSSININHVIKSRRMIWAEYVACMEDRRSAHRDFMRRPERRKPHERPRHRWQDTTEMNLQEAGWRMNRNAVAPVRDMWRALGNAVMKFQANIKRGTFLD